MRLNQSLRLAEYAGKPVVALAGAGGKSSLLFRLGDELGAARLNVLLTATTKMWARQIDRAPFTLVAADPLLLSVELPISLRGYRQVLALSGPAAEPGKLAGLPPDVVCRLAALADVEAVVVEADGSRERPLKAPAQHEPVVPPCATHVVTVAGMDVVGRPLGDRWVHRPERVAELTGLRLGDLLTPEAIARLLAHPQGGLQGHPAGAISTLFLNLILDPLEPGEQAEQRLAAARQIATHVLAGSRRYAAVLIGSPQAAEPVQEVHGRVAGVVLAAGASTRMAGAEAPKQLLPWGEGDTLVGHVAGLALAARTLTDALVVAGNRSADVTAAVAGRHVRVVDNPDWASGQSSSIHAALRSLPEDTAAAVFLLADQPDVHPATIDALVEAHRRTQAPIVMPVYRDGQRGNPVLFDRSTFPELLALRGDSGGRPLIERCGSAVHPVAIDRPQPQGIETWADYENRCAAANQTCT